MGTTYGPLRSYGSPSTVHPHACGDDIPTARSSDRSSRFTPTPVGTTEKKSGFPRCVAVHPHACGDDVTQRVGRVVLPRFTPTPVGTTHEGSSSPACGRPVHPHACGDDPRTARASGQPSPVHPHACGDDGSTRSSSSPHRRFTPTPVGTTPPHSVFLILVIGSPPRLWGRLVRAGPPAGLQRFTPTPVGTTEQYRQPSPQYTRFTPTPVGTTPSLDPGGRISSGSPPRLWGRLTASGEDLVEFHGSPPRLWGRRTRPGISM